MAVRAARARRGIAAAAVVRRAVAMFVVPLVALHVKAANVVASHSIASGNVAAGTVSPDFDAVYVIVFDIVAGRVGGQDKRWAEQDESERATLGPGRGVAE